MKNKKKNKAHAILCLIVVSLPIFAAENKVFEAIPGETLTLSFPAGGSAEVIGWDKKEIEIDYADSSNDLSIWDIQAEAKQGGFFITADVNERVRQTSLHFKIRVPFRYNVELSSAGGGLVLSDLEGRFKGKTGGGSLTLVRLKGVADLRSGGGEIRVEESELDGSVKTGGGTVLVKDVIGNVDVSSGGGNISYQNVRTRAGDLRTPSGETDEEITQDTVLIKTAGGSINVDEAPYGAIVQTGGGSVSVHRAQNFVSAKTGGGDISIEVENGWAVAKTGAGDIEVHYEGAPGFNGKDSRISSGLGDITLWLTEDADVDLELVLKLSNDSDHDYQIISDFPIQEEVEDSTNRFKNMFSHKKKAYSLNPGGHRISVETTNGNIKIKRVQSK